MIKTVNIVGSGNVAHFFMHHLAGKAVVKSVFKRSAQVAFNPYEEPLIQVVNKIDLLEEADLTIIAVKDDSIEEVVKQLDASLSVVHTSGSVPLSILKKFKRSGVLYPLQTISKARIPDLKKVPFLIEAGSKDFEKELMDFSRKYLFEAPVIFSSEMRAQIHLAAVIGNNFTNFLLVKSHEIMQNAGADFNLLKPLLIETIEKAFSSNPREAQTGPAKRNDMQVIRKQSEMIGDPDFRELYLTISKIISSEFKA